MQSIVYNLKFLKTVFHYYSIYFAIIFSLFSVPEQQQQKQEGHDGPVSLTWVTSLQVLKHEDQDGPKSLTCMYMNWPATDIVIQNYTYGS